MKEIYLVDFIQETKDVFGSCSIIDQIPIESIPAFASFTKIVWNYMKMQEILNK